MTLGGGVSKYDDIKLPHDKYEIGENTRVEIPTYENNEVRSDDTDNEISKDQGTGKSFIRSKHSWQI